VQQKGFPTIVKFLRSGDFKSSFGVTLDEFSMDLKNSLLTPSPVRTERFSISHPEWRIGDKWIYHKTIFGTSTTTFKKVIGEDVFRGTPVFIVRNGEGDMLYAKPGLGFVGSRRNGKMISEVDKVNQVTPWPLEPQKETRISFTSSDIQKNSMRNDRVILVPGKERIHVAAGEFEAIKIEVYEGSNGRLREEYWYSPKVKWFVKIRNYRSVGITEEELVRAELKLSVN
jgi:hypothetical protein